MPAALGIYKLIWQLRQQGLTGLGSTAFT